MDGMNGGLCLENSSRTSRSGSCRHGIGIVSVGMMGMIGGGRLRSRGGERREGHRKRCWNAHHGGSGASTIGRSVHGTGGGWRLSQGVSD